MSTKLIEYLKTHPIFKKRKSYILNLPIKNQEVIYTSLLLFGELIIGCNEDFPMEIAATAYQIKWINLRKNDLKPNFYLQTDTFTMDDLSIIVISSPNVCFKVYQSPEVGTDKAEIQILDYL